MKDTTFAIFLSIPQDNQSDAAHKNNAHVQLRMFSTQSLVWKTEKKIIPIPSLVYNELELDDSLHLHFEILQ